MNLKDYPDVLTVKDVADVLHIGINTAYSLLQTGELKSCKIGRIYRVPKAYLSEYLCLTESNTNDLN